MADKPQHSVSASEEDNLYKLALGKIDQYRILERMYRKVCEENQDLEKKLSGQGKSRNNDSSEAQFGTEPRLRRSFSITQQMLDAASTQTLDHPAEFYQVMEKEKNEEIETLRKKAENTQRYLKKVHHETDELRRQIQQLMNAIAEKDGRMKELEQRYQETLTEEERCNHLERERRLRELAHQGDSSFWEVVNQWKTPLEKPTLENLMLEKKDDETPGTIELRRKIDELQRRITELLNHNEKWNTLCQGLQEELDRVKRQLQQYQKAEMVEHSLHEDLKFETKRRKEAEEMSTRARKQVEELEAKVCNLEKQLEDKERQERQMFMVAQELREQASIYEEQIKIYKDDFENEQRDHSVTRSQLDSMKNQWLTIYKNLQEKTQQLMAMSQQMEKLGHNNEELERQLEQAHRDEKLIRDHQKQHEERTRTPPTEDLMAWECQRCTYINQETAIVCKMCSTSRHHSLLSEPSASRGHASNTTVDQRVSYDKMSFGTAPRMGQLEEDGISCY